MLPSMRNRLGLEFLQGEPLHATDSDIGQPLKLTPLVHKGQLFETSKASSQLRIHTGILCSRPSELHIPRLTLCLAV
jgi:hypothetical protein